MESYGKKIGARKLVRGEGIYRWAQNGRELFLDKRRLGANWAQNGRKLFLDERILGANWAQNGRKLFLDERRLGAN